MKPKLKSAATGPNSKAAIGRHGAAHGSTHWGILSFAIMSSAVTTMIWEQCSGIHSIYFPIFYGSGWTAVNIMWWRSTLNDQAEL